MARGDSKLIFGELSYAINGVLFTVHNTLGRYCNEQQYGDAVAHALNEKRIAHEREYIVPVSFDGEATNRNKIVF